MATDTLRLAQQKLNIENEGKYVFIVPTKALIEISRLIEDEIEIKVSVSERQASFKIGDTVVISRLLEGKFPNYKQVIPNSFLGGFTVKTSDILDATNRTMLISSSEQHTPKTRVFLNGKLQLLAESNAGKILEEIPADIEGLNGEELVTFLNSKFLMDCLKVSDFEKLSFSFTGPLTPCMVKPDDDDSYFSIMVPLKE